MEENGGSEVTRSLRDIPPSHYIFKIEPFSQLSKALLDTEVQSYESDIFQASDYKWRLSLYPNGDEKRNGKGYISLYLVIAETSKLPLGWEVNVNFKLFVYNQIQDKYLTIQDANGKVSRFHGMITEWGFPQLVSLTTFNDPSNGYLIGDKCMFGAEVFVLNYSGRAEFLSFKELDIIHTWKIENFSSLDAEYVVSDVFTAESCKWILCLYPKGCPEEKVKCLSLFLGLYNGESFPPERKLYAHYSLCIRNQHNGNHKKITGRSWFSTTLGDVCGESTFLSLTDLHDSNKGFLVNDTYCRVQSYCYL